MIDYASDDDGVAYHPTTENGNESDPSTYSDHDYDFSRHYARAILNVLNLLVDSTHLLS